MKESQIRPTELYQEFLELVEREVKERFKDVNKELIGCPACLSSNFEFAFEKLGFSYVECLNCDSVYVNPSPLTSEVNAYYKKSEAVRFFAEKLYEQTKQVRKEKIFRPRAELIEELIKKNVTGAPRIIDIGGGAGLLIDELRRIGLDGEVIEPSDELAAVCERRNIQVYRSFFEEFDLSKLRNRGGAETVIMTSFELIEHLRNPESFFQHAYNILNEGDYLFFTTLNGNGFDLRVLWEESKSFLPPLHLVFFNPVSIKMLLERLGFHVEEISTPGLLDWDIVKGAMTRNHITTDRFWRIFHRTANESQERLFQKFLQDSNFSSHMRIIARK